MESIQRDGSNFRGATLIGCFQPGLRRHSLHPVTKDLRQRLPRYPAQAASPGSIHKSSHTGFPLPPAPLNAVLSLLFPFIELNLLCEHYSTSLK